MTVASYGVHETSRKTVYMVRLVKGDDVQWLYRFDNGSRVSIKLHKQYSNDGPIPSSAYAFDTERKAKGSLRARVVKWAITAGWRGEIVEVTHVSTQEITPIHLFPVETDAVALLGHVDTTP